MFNDLLSEIRAGITSGNYERAIEKIQTIPRQEYNTEQLLQQAILPLLNLEQAYHIIVFGDMVTDTTEFKRSISNFFPVQGEMIRIRFDEVRDTFGFEVGYIKLDEFTSLILWSPAGTTRWTKKLFEPLVQTRNLLGCILLIDSSKLPYIFREVRYILNCIVRQNDQLFEEFLPYVIAVDKQDHSKAWDVEDLRIVFRIGKEEKLLLCNMEEKESVKSVLLELLYSVRENIKD